MCTEKKISLSSVGLIPISVGIGLQPQIALYLKAVIGQNVPPYYYCRSYAIQSRLITHIYRSRCVELYYQIIAS